MIARPAGRGVRHGRVSPRIGYHDCVVVGGGPVAGAVADAYRERFGEDARVLVLEAPDEAVLARCGVLDRPVEALPRAGSGLVVRVRPAVRWPGGLADVLHVPAGADGRLATASLDRASHVVVTAWSRVTARLVQGLPWQQVRDLATAEASGRGGAEPVVFRNVAVLAAGALLPVTPEGPGRSPSTTDVTGRAVAGLPEPSAPHWARSALAG